MNHADPGREFLRHTIATLAYRGAKAVCGTPDGFGPERIGGKTRSPVEILAHVGDLLDWAQHLCRGEHVWHDSAPQSWEREVERFFEGLRKLDEWLASDARLGVPAERVFQGPIADALTHIGQISMLRRLAGTPVRGENYFKAEIRVGRVSAEQASPVREFD